MMPSNGSIRMRTRAGERGSPGAGKKLMLAQNGFPCGSRLNCRMERAMPPAGVPSRLHPLNRPRNKGWLLSASGVMEARGGGFGYDDGSRRSAVAGEHEGFLSSWPQRTRSTSHPCSMTRNASPWCASTAGQRASVALDAAATRWSGTGTTTRNRIGSGIAARRARRALTTSAGQCWRGTTSRCGSGCCASTSWV